eukprot:gene29535-39152_t
MRNMVRRAREILLTGDPFTAAQGLQWGVINAVWNPAGLIPEAVDLAGRIAANAPLSVRNIRRVARETAVLSGAAAIAVELAAYNELTPTEDRREGVAAWGEKRKSMRKVLSSTATNCSGFSSEPAFICVVAKPPIETARSIDHFTSLDRASPASRRSSAWWQS